VPLTSVVAHLLAAPSGGSGGGGGSSLVNFLPLILIVGVGYLLLIRPARTRQKRALETRSSVEPGAEVTTTAGLIATVVAVDDDSVTLEVAPGVHSKYLKGAIARVNTPLEELPDDDDSASSGSSGSVPPQGSVSLDKPEPTEN
jgi:preprotein translocase subunit YajC